MTGYQKATSICAMAPLTSVPRERKFGILEPGGRIPDIVRYSQEFWPASETFTKNLGTFCPKRVFWRKTSIQTPWSDPPEAGLQCDLDASPASVVDCFSYCCSLWLDTRSSKISGDHILHRLREIHLNEIHPLKERSTPRTTMPRNLQWVRNQRRWLRQRWVSVIISDECFAGHHILRILIRLNTLGHSRVSWHLNWTHGATEERTLYSLPHQGLSSNPLVNINRLISWICRISAVNALLLMEVTSATEDAYSRVNCACDFCVWPLLSLRPSCSFQRKLTSLKFIIMTQNWFIFHCVE